MAPPLMANSFALFTSKTAPFYFAGMPFVIAAVSTFIALILLISGNKKRAVQKMELVE